MSNAEQSTLLGLATSDATPEKIAEKVAPLMGRSETAIVAGIVKARQELQSQAGDYVKLHRKAAEKAAEQGNSKPAEWMLERLEAGGERVVAPPKTEQAGNGVQIILANVRLGGMLPAANTEVIDAEVNAPSNGSPHSSSE